MILPVIIDYQKNFSNFKVCSKEDQLQVSNFYTESITQRTLINSIGNKLFVCI